MQNYKINEYGVIQQIEISPKVYDTSYIANSYNVYDTTTNMSYLRLGYLLGAIGATPQSILDVGYGNGDFLKCASTIIPQCFGNDVSGYPLPPNVTFVEDILSRHFDVITFFDSLEHFHNIDFVSELDCDYIFISVPWCHNFSDEWFMNWKHRREDEHIHHFNEMSLVHFMNSKGFDVLNISNFEDSIRKPVDDNENILSALFVRENLHVTDY